MSRTPKLSRVSCPACGKNVARKIDGTLYGAQSTVRAHVLDESKADLQVRALDGDTQHMKRKQLNEIMVGWKTYQHATESCRRHFLAHVNRDERENKARKMDTQVREGWLWFWRGWFRQ